MSDPNRRRFLGGAAAALAAPTLLRSATRPNVLVILTDDQGYGDFSCHGNPVLKTPNMDKLHSESVRFTDFHAAPMCTPTRGQLMTGQDALRNGATSVTAGRAVVRRGIPMMPEIFRENGYSTGIFGKWHLGDNYPYRPMDRGFQRAMYHLGWGFSAAPEFDNDYFNGRYHDQGVLRKFTGYCTDFWFDQAMTWMKDRQSAKSPFLCYLPTNTPHTPAWVDEKYSAPYKKPGLPAEFFGMIANLDENLGRLDGFLKSSGLRDNTLVVFMTDNGATGGRNVFNSGMRGHKTTNYEGGHRVPCFVRWPAAGWKTGRDVAAPTQLQDILPTLIDVCGLKAPKSFAPDGTSLKPLLDTPGAALRDRMMVVQYGQTPKRNDGCVIWNRWRLVNGTELYHLDSDPAQATNVAEKNPEVLRKMREHYDRWWAGVSPRLTDFEPTSIGAKEANTVELTSSDWQDIYCDNVGHISNAVGGPRGGPWSIYVERDGDYEIALSRWPPWQRLALTAGRPVQKMTKGQLPEGKALPIAKAQLRIAGQEHAAATAESDTAAKFRVNLKGGVKTTLQGWFQDAGGTDLAGAFYASVTRL
ncbi:MAG: arylsulfatase [Bryobacteraceae bacterium]|nr:arylsulfatase [Bryobacteraceae bacterium]